MPERYGIRKREWSEEQYQEYLGLYYGHDVVDSLLNIQNQIPEWIIDGYNDECSCLICSTVRGFVCARHAAVECTLYGELLDCVVKFAEEQTHPSCTFTSERGYRYNWVNIEGMVRSALKRANGRALTVSQAQSLYVSECTVCGGAHPSFIVNSTTQLCTNCIIQDGVYETRTCMCCSESTLTIDGEVRGEETVVFDHDGLNLCTDCFDLHNVQMCVCCGERWVADTQWGGDVSWRYDVTYRSEDASVCDNCYDDFYNCSTCDHQYHVLEVPRVWYDRERRTCCEVCAEDLEYCDLCGGLCFDQQCSCVNNFVLNYSHKPKTYFQRTKLESPDAEHLYFGLELEYELISSVDINRPAMEVCNAINEHLSIPVVEGGGARFTFVYAKRDSTLSNGAEFVTHPFTFAWYKENLGAFEQFFMALNQYFTVRESCGMHVHFSRTKHGLKFGRLYKLCHLLYGYPFLAERIAGRYNGKLSSYGAVTNEDRSSILSKSKGHSRGQRNSAVNCKPTSTIELRLFGAPPDFEQFQQRMETAKALYEFSLAAGLSDCTPGAFVEFVHKGQDSYPRLYDHIKNFKG